MLVVLAQDLSSPILIKGEKFKGEKLKWFKSKKEGHK